MIDERLTNFLNSYLNNTTAAVSVPASYNDEEDDSFRIPEAAYAGFKQNQKTDALISELLATGLEQMQQQINAPSTPNESQSYAQSQPSVSAPTSAEAQPKQTALIAFGTNDSNPERTYANTIKAINEARNKNLNPVVIPPTNSGRFQQLSKAVVQAAIDSKTPIEQVNAFDTDGYHIAMQEAKRLAAKYRGALAIGDSNAVRICNFSSPNAVNKEGTVCAPNNVATARVGAFTDDILTLMKNIK